MNGKKLVACLAGLAMVVTTGTAFAQEDEGGIGDQKKVEGAGLSHQGKTVGKYGRKVEGARRRIGKGRREGNIGLQGANIRKRQGKRPSLKDRKRMGRGARNIQRGRRSEKRNIKKGVRRGKRRPRVVKPRPTREQAVDNLKKDLLVE
jgi:hypothetical protein